MMNSNGIDDPYQYRHQQSYETSSINTNTNTNTTTNSTSVYYDYDVSPTYNVHHQYGNDRRFYDNASFLGPQGQDQTQTQDPVALGIIASSTEPGYYYPVAPPILPQWGPAPVTALAYDDTYAAIYVASATLFNGRYPITTSTTTRCWKAQQADQPCYDRSSMLSVHSTSSSANPIDNGIMYASVAGHPEASRNTLMDVYASIYGFSGSTTNTNTNTTTNNSSRGSKPTNSPKRPAGGHHHAHHHHIPSHAYKPVYGRIMNAATTGMDLATAMTGGTFAVGKDNFHRGITTLLPLAGSGSVASVSPSAVRVHTHGGLQLADQPLCGMLCGTFHPAATTQQQQQQQQQQQTPSHITVGGISVNHGNAQQQQQQHHAYCLDVWRGLQIVTSRTIQDTDHDSSSSIPLGITAMATSHKRGSIVAGCSDGKIRFLDTSLREVAKIRAHAGGVTDVCVSDDGMLIATTGYGYRPAGSTFLYAFPEPNIQLFDIRFLGKFVYLIIFLLPCLINHDELA
jgi:hypothetical protein